MEIIIQENEKVASFIGARITAGVIRKKFDCVLGLATGSTPLLLYKELIRLHKQEGLDFERVTSFNLDEYVGLPLSHPASYNSYMWKNFFKYINICIFLLCKSTHLLSPIISLGPFGVDV